MSKKMETMEMPEPYLSASDKFMDMDRTWFEDHPKRSNYVREAIPFEWAHECNARYVQVIQIGPGFRVRMPVYYRAQFSDAARAVGMSVLQYARNGMENHIHAMPADEVRRMFAKHQN